STMRASPNPGGNGPVAPAPDPVQPEFAPVRADRWEHGSGFHLSLDIGETRYPWSDHPHAYWGSGRDALRSLIGWGHGDGSWSRVLCPSFYCPEAVVAIRQEADVAVYPDAPMMPGDGVLAAGPRDVALVVSLYGRRPAIRVTGAAIILEDHSHDPVSGWARTSQADYAFASLSKTLPLPDGGVLWSPHGFDLPREREMTKAHESAVLDRLSAMILKRLYLSGSAIAKDHV